MPRIRGLGRAEAKARLVAAGLKVASADKKVASGVVAKGKALNTYPSYLMPDGSARKLARGTTVWIKVSTGP